MKCNYIYLGCHKRYIEMFWMIWFCNFKVFKTSFWSGQWCTLSAHILQTQTTNSRTWKMLFFHETLILKWLHQVCYGGSEKNCMWHFYDENLHRPKWNSFLMNTEAWETVARYECDKKSSKRSCLCMLQLKTDIMNKLAFTVWHLARFLSVSLFFSAAQHICSLSRAPPFQLNPSIIPHTEKANRSKNHGETPMLQKIWKWKNNCGTFKRIVHPKMKMYTHPQAKQDVDEFDCSSEQIWRNLALHHLLINGSSAVNGCRHNESPNSW